MTDYWTGRLLDAIEKLQAHARNILYDDNAAYDEVEADFQEYQTLRHMDGTEIHLDQIVELSRSDSPIGPKTRGFLADLFDKNASTRFVAVLHMRKRDRPCSSGGRYNLEPGIKKEAAVDTLMKRHGKAIVAENLTLNSDNFSYLFGYRPLNFAAISAKALLKIAYCHQRRARGSSVLTNPLSSCCDSTASDCRRISRLFVLPRGLTGRRCLRQLRRRVRACSFGLASRPVERRAFTRARRRGEAA